MHWLIPTKLILFVTIAFWSSQLDSLIFNLKIYIIYGNQYNNSIIRVFGESIIWLCGIYFIVSLIIHGYNKFIQNHKPWKPFLEKNEQKIKITLILTLIATILYIFQGFLLDTIGGRFPYLALTLFLITALLNFLSGTGLGILRLPSFLSQGGFKGDLATDPWVYHQSYLIIISVIMMAVIWNYFLSCLVIKIKEKYFD